MKEFEYPMWFKSLTNNQVIEFDSIDTGTVVKKGFLDECNNIGYYDLWIPHTDVMTWVNVTDQYKEKTEIPPLKMCGTPKCAHDMPYDSECEECQNEVQKKQKQNIKDVYMGRAYGSIKEEIFNDLRSYYFSVEEKHPLKNEASKHYELWNDLEVIELIEKVLTKEELIGACKFNILKYRLRIGNKDDSVKELQKIKDYENYLKFLDGKNVEK